eukprot:1180974-Prorocentrum_minimum.AAC.1
MATMRCSVVSATTDVVAPPSQGEGFCFGETLFLGAEKPWLIRNPFFSERSPLSSADVGSLERDGVASEGMVGITRAYFRLSSVGTVK